MDAHVGVARFLEAYSATSGAPSVSTFERAIAHPQMTVRLEAGHYVRYGLK